MRTYTKLFCFPCVGFPLIIRTYAAAPVLVSVDPPANASVSSLESFVSSHWSSPRFQTFLVCVLGFEQGKRFTAAENTNHPSVFCHNLLKSLGALQGSYPIIRVGGNTQ